MPAEGLYDLHCLDIRTGLEIPERMLSKESYPWRDLHHQMGDLAMLNRDFGSFGIIYFIKNTEELT